MNEAEKLKASRQYWNNLAPTFDDEPDHGLRDPNVLKSWTNFLRSSLPFSNATLLDIGCGTGSISVVLAGFGHKVIGVDLSPAMISIAKNKAAKMGLDIEFQVKDAASLELVHSHFDAIICRHLLWTLPEPPKVLKRWSNFLKTNGRLILIEGYWNAEGGLHADEIIGFLPPAFASYQLHNLAKNSAYWGGDVDDERYAIIAEKSDRDGRTNYDL